MNTDDNTAQARTKISGNRFVELDGAGSDRVTLSASFRGRKQVITGETRQVSTMAMDAVPGECAVYCAPATRALAESLFERWNNALQTGDAERVTACYAEDAVLLATVSNIPRTSHAEIKDYFAHFLQKKPFGKVLQRNVKIGCNKVTDAGVYTFRILDAGVAKDIPARYTFVYESKAGEWLISHHHSSMMPE